MPVAIPEMLHVRRRPGADRFDEMWQGVLHMTPAAGPVLHLRMCGDLPPRG